jgi:uncharacterized protein (TIGR02118 family)
MAEAKIMVMYPRPTDTAAFDRAYQDEHVPMVLKNFAGLTKFVQTSVTGTVQGTPPFYRLAELYFPSMEVLQAAAASASGQQTLAHGIAISTGGPMVILTAEEQTTIPEQR